jgi:hypothetical protein
MDKEPCTFTDAIIGQYCTRHKNHACLGPKAWLKGDPIPSATHCGSGERLYGRLGFYEGNYCKDCISSIHRQMEPICEKRRQEFQADRQAFIDQQEQFLARCRSEYRDLHMDRWKRISPPIDYPSEHKGKWLVDLLLSPDKKERDHVKWLGWTAKLRWDRMGKPFTELELEDFERCKSEARTLYNDLIKFGNKRVKSKRDASPTRT